MHHHLYLSFHTTLLQFLTLESESKLVHFLKEFEGALIFRINPCLDTKSTNMMTSDKHQHFTESIWPKIAQTDLQTLYLNHQNSYKTTN